MSKRRRVFLFPVLALLLLLPLAARADACPLSPAGQHVWGEWYYFDESDRPTCYAPGKLTRWCMACQQQDTQSVPPLDHQYGEWYIIQDPTCNAEGIQARYCMMCQNQDTQAIPASGRHRPTAIPAVAATCTAGGKTEGSKCIVCGTVLTEQTDTPALGHSWDNGAVTEPASCSKEGVRTYTCARCGAARTETIGKTGHTPTAISGKAATCTETGRTEGSQCAVCGTILTAQKDTPALGHSFDGGVVAQASTCVRQGTKTFTCTRCGLWYTEKLPLAPHTPSVLPAAAATCTETGRTEGSQCAVCGTILTAQKDTPALGHHWDGGRVTTPKTCTVNGVWTQTCTRCGETIASVLTASGHSWDAGAVTKNASLLLDGEMTYTCVVCGAVKTETIPSLFGHHGAGSDSGSLFSIIRNVDPDTEADGPLTVVIQPQPGKVSRDGAFRHTMTVEVSGGVPPYTYQWRYRNEKTRKETMEDFKNALASEKVSGAAGSYFKNKDGVSAYSVTHLWSADAMVNASSAAGSKAAAYTAAHNTYDMDALTSLIAGIFASGKPSDNAGAASSAYPSAFNLVSGSEFNWDSFSWNADNKAEEIALQTAEAITDIHIIQDGTDWSYTAIYGGRVYDCVITDAAGSAVTTDGAAVGYLPRITRQPEDINASPRADNYTRNRDMSVKVEDGTPPYAYQWMKIDDSGNQTMVFGEQKNTIRLLSPNYARYFCRVTDADGDVVQSAPGRFYYADYPLVVDGLFDAVWEGKPITLSAQIRQGLPPYEIQWLDDSGSLIFSEVSDHVTELEVNQAGVYTLVVKDETAHILTKTVEITAAPLTIVRQPEGGEAAYGKPHTLSIFIADGRAPFLYALERDGEIVETAASDMTYHDFSVTEGGFYRIYVYDADDRDAVSSDVYVGDDAFYLVSYTDEGEITKPNGHCTLSLHVAGGTSPYTYQWEVYDSSGSGGYRDLVTKTGAQDRNDSNAIYKPGYYRCIVTDSVGRKVTATNMRVKYAGAVPWIILEPQEETYPYSDQGLPYVQLTCDAISGSGNNANLQFTWAKSTDYNFQMVLIDGSIGTGKTLTLLEGYTNPIDGFYHCQVTDLSTGESANTGRVKVGMIFEPLSGQEIGSGKAYNHILQVECVGGCAPYRIAKVEFHPILYVRGAGGYSALEDDHTTHYDYKPFCQDLSTQHHAKFIIQTQFGVSYGQNTYEVKSGTYAVLVEDALGQYVKVEFSVSAPTDLKSVW